MQFMAALRMPPWATTRVEGRPLLTMPCKALAPRLSRSHPLSPSPVEATKGWKGLADSGLGYRSSASAKGSPASGPVVPLHPVGVVLDGNVQHLADNPGALGGPDESACDDQVERDGGVLPLLGPRPHLRAPNVGERRVVSALMHHLVVGAGAAVPHQGDLYRFCQLNFLLHCKEVGT